MKIYEKKHHKAIYFGVIMSIFMLAVVMGLVWDNTYFSRMEEKTAKKWTVVNEKTEDGYAVSFTVPADAVMGKYIAFKTAHFEATVDIDGEIIYSIKAGNTNINHSTGYRWNFVELRQEDAGKTMTITYTSAYKNMVPLNTIYYGGRYAIEKDIFTANIFRFALSIGILFIGILLLICDYFIMKKSNEITSLFHFALFSICIGVWSIAESPISWINGTSPMAIMMLDHYSLMFMPLLFAMYIRPVFYNKENKVWDIYIWFNYVVIGLRTIFQITGLFDLKQTLFLTQLSLGIGVAMIVVCCIVELAYSKMSKISSQLKINIFCTLLIMAAAILDLTGFLFSNRRNIFGTLGFAIYVVITSADMIKRSFKMMDRARENEVYRQLAYTDELTGLYNRMAFQHDMNNRMSQVNEAGEQSISPTTICMFDLNDLKKCNDNFGHDNGDKYIKMVADVIQEIFGIDGRCFRIGGDEFAVIMSSVSNNEITRMLNSMDRSINILNRKGFVVPVSVAAGYAVYDKKIDKSLEDTLKRADVLMYENKQEIKKKRLA
jgi:diguanylate cyclase (GGDEF)-like protein